MNKPLASLEAVIFDLDGTLLDTLQSLANCYNRILAAHGYPTHPVDAYRYFIGDGARTCLTRCLPAEVSNTGLIDDLLALQQVDYEANWHRDVEVYQGIEALLQALSSRGVPLGVLSNKDHRFVEQCVAHFFPQITFLGVQGFDRDVPHKPDPTGALRLAAQLSSDPQRIGMVGDTAVDMQTASGAGFVAIGALWGFRDEVELMEAGADRTIEAPEELLRLLRAPAL